MNLVPTKALLLDLLAAATQAASGAAGPLHTAYLGLYVAPTPLPSFNMVIGDITEAGFTGYARQALVWGPAYVTQAGNVGIDGGSLHWQPSDAVTPQTISGVFIATALTAGTLLAALQLDNPVALPDAYHLLDAVQRFALDPSAYWGDVEIVC